MPHNLIPTEFMPSELQTGGPKESQDFVDLELEFLLAWSSVTSCSSFFQPNDVKVLLIDRSIYILHYVLLLADLLKRVIDAHRKLKEIHVKMKITEGNGDCAPCWARKLNVTMELLRKLVKAYQAQSIEKAICRTVQNIAAPIIAERVPKYKIDTVEFETLTLGSLPPTFQG
ncbi:hypothetical protein RND71_039742 [Anisodus tanguticus]|uniref:Uncharacterized protein n=1 Tax=Anisodus tanguticus TaxID=243964 RepID=A0AAE1QXE3_9SOLA|nr:hypothetical protein RND71_039742 [Anisodus tanguticus]